MKHILSLAALALFIYLFGSFIIYTLIVIGVVIMVIWALLGGGTRFTRTVNNPDGTKTVIVKRYKWFKLISVGSTTSQVDA